MSCQRITADLTVYHNRFAGIHFNLINCFHNWGFFESRLQMRNGMTSSVSDFACVKFKISRFQSSCVQDNKGSVVHEMDTSQVLWHRDSSEFPGDSTAVSLVSFVASDHGNISLARCRAWSRDNVVNSDVSRCLKVGKIRDQNFTLYLLC